MAWDVAEKTLRKFAAQGGREVIPSTMGEPLLYSHFNRLVDFCRENSLQMNIVTNGTFPQTAFCQNIEDWAHLLLPVCRDIKISLMGFSTSVNETLMKGTVQSRLLDSVSHLVSIRDKARKQKEKVSQISLQVTLCRENLKEISNILEFAGQAGVDRIKWNRVFFLSEAGSDFREKYELPEDVDFERELILKNSKIKMEGNFLIPANRGNRECPFLGKELWVLPDGSEELCPHPQVRFGVEKSKKLPCADCALI